jgi:hypothetical protein
VSSIHEIFLDERVVSVVLGESATGTLQDEVDRDTTFSEYCVLETYQPPLTQHKRRMRYGRL